MVRLSADLDHSLERMVRHACILLKDAGVIRQHSEATFTFPGGGGEYLLRLMALEILLKASALRESGALRKFGHDFAALFAAQPANVRDTVRNEFGARGLERAGLDTGAPLETQLGRLTSNYERARYLYEASLPFSREEREAREQAFVSGSLPVEEWDIIYHAEFVDLVAETLISELSSWVPDWFASN